MSIVFADDMNEETAKRLQEMFKDSIVALDERIALINESSFKQSDMKELANTAKQPATLELHGEGEIKKMSDGTEYIVTPQGWRKK